MIFRRSPRYKWEKHEAEQGAVLCNPASASEMNNCVCAHLCAHRICSWQNTVGRKVEDAGGVGFNF